MNPLNHHFLKAVIFCWIFLFPFVLSAQAPDTKPKKSILEKQITLVYRSETLENILFDIHEKYNVHFSYINELVPLTSTTYLSVKDQPLNRTLDELFRNTFINYYLIGEQIVLIEEKVIDSLGLNTVEKIKSSTDSVKVYALNKKYKSKNRRPFKTYTVSDFFKGTSRLTLTNYSIYGNPKTSADSSSTDSLSIQKDSLGKSYTARYTKSEKRNTANMAPSGNEGMTGKFAINFFLTPEFSNWRMISHTAGLAVKKYNDYGKSELGLTIATTFDYRIGEKLLFSSGLYITGINKYYDHTDHIDQISNPTETHTYKYSYTFLGIPLLVGIKLAEKKIGVTLYGGYILNFFSSKTGASDDYDIFTVQSTTVSPEKIPVVYRKLDLAFYLNPQINIKLSKRFQLITGISAEIFMNSINDPKGAPVKERPTLIGLKSGVRYQF